MRPKADWATFALVVLTCLTIGFMVGLVARDWNRFIVMPLNEIGDFLAGTAGALAFIWVVFGYLQQAKSISIQQDELRASVQALEKQAGTTAEQLALQKRELDFTLARLVKADKPFFVCSSTCREGRREKQHQEFTFELSNIGNYATQVLITSSDCFVRFEGQTFHDEITAWQNGKTYIVKFNLKREVFEQENPPKIYFTLYYEGADRAENSAKIEVDLTYHINNLESEYPIQLIDATPK